MTTLFPADKDIESFDEEQLPVPRHRRHGIRHFFGLYGAEHIAATEFIIGATLVTLGAGFLDVVLGLLIGNILAILSFWLLTARIATEVRLSLYTYLTRIAGNTTSRLYNLVNVAFFGIIAAAMITVASTGVTLQFDVPLQTEAYPTSLWFVVVVGLVSAVVVTVAIFGFNALSEFASICAPWLAFMFVCGAAVLIPPLLESVTGQTTIGFGGFIDVAKSDIFSGETPDGEPGIGFWGVVGFAWAANSVAHVGLIDMALLRYARKSWHGLGSASGLLIGHYIGWICAGVMGAAVAAITQTPLGEISPGLLTFEALGWTGLVIIVVAGWTTANSNLYRAGLAAQAVFPGYSRGQVTAVLGIGIVIAACFPFFYRSILPLLTYAGLAVMPIGGVVFAEHYLFPRLGLTRYWMHFKGLERNVPALATWAIGIAFAAILNFSGIIIYYYIFVPTFVLSVIVYILLARAMGAAEDYPDAEERERNFNERVATYHEKLAESEGLSDGPPERTALGHAIRAVWILAGLVTPLVFAMIVLFGSPDLDAYESNVARFYDVAIWCTGIYFVFAYWGLRRQKARWEEARDDAREDDGVTAQ